MTTQQQNEILKTFTIGQLKSFIKENDTFRNDSVYNLELVQHLQMSNPLLILGGSTALYLYGCKIQRHDTINPPDLDLVFPYFNILNYDISKYQVLDKEDRVTSGSDFVEKGSIGIFNSKIEPEINKHIKFDLRIDPYNKFRIIEYKGFKYKVCELETILEAKIRYNNPKHKQDLRDMLEIN
jgi:hypothetical protein